MDDFSHVAWISSASRRLSQDGEALPASGSLPNELGFVDPPGASLRPCWTAHRRLADSNLDFGQAEGYLIRYVEQHTEVIVEPAGPQAGTLLVSVNHLTAVLGRPERYAWLRENFEPVGHLAYAYLIYEISPEDLEAIEP